MTSLWSVEVVKFSNGMWDGEDTIYVQASSKEDAEQIVSSYLKNRESDEDSEREEVTGNTFPCRMVK